MFLGTQELFSNIPDSVNIKFRCVRPDVWTASLNEVQLQIWGTWLFYAILVDLGDAVAEELEILFQQISLEMIYRGMYHFM